MSKRGILTELFSCLLSVMFFAGGEARSADTIHVPFEWKGGHLVVQGSIGELKDLNLVIDTGASYTTVSRKVARKLGLKGRKKKVLAYGDRVEVEEVRLPSVKIGRLCLEEVTAWATDRLSVPDARQMLRMDALIGLDFLRQTNLTIDYTSQILRFGAMDTATSFQPFYPGLPFLMLRMSVEGQPIRLMLDSGAEDLILFQRSVGDRFQMKRTRETKGIRHSGGRAKLRKVRLSNVVMGATDWNELDAFLLEGPVPDSGLDGVLGIRALGLQRLSLDFHTHRISWER